MCQKGGRFCFQKQGFYWNPCFGHVDKQDTFLWVCVGDFHQLCVCQGLRSSCLNRYTHSDLSLNTCGCSISLLIVPSLRSARVCLAEAADGGGGCGCRGVEMSLRCGCCACARLWTVVVVVIASDATRHLWVPTQPATSLPLSIHWLITWFPVDLFPPSPATVEFVPLNGSRLMSEETFKESQTELSQLPPFHDTELSGSAEGLNSFF